MMMLKIAEAAVPARLGVPHIVLHQKEPRFRAELRKNRLTSFCTDEHAQSLVPPGGGLRPC